MKVLFINEVCGVTSTGRICTDIAQLLEKQGHTAYVGYGRKTVPEKMQKYAVKIGGKAGVYAHALLSRVFDNTGFYSYLATKKFIKWVKQYNPDVIHLHNLHGYYINIKLLFEYLKKCSKPIVWTLHDCWGFTGHCSYYDFAGCQKWKRGCHNCPQKREYPASFLFDRSKRNYIQKKKLFCGVSNLRIITPSEWLKKQVEQSFLGEYPVSVINNGIDTSVFKPTQSDFKKQHGIEDKVMLLGVANIWAQRKGFRDFEKIANEINDNYRIVLVGDLYGNECPKNIIHVAHTNSIYEMADIYSAADVFLNLTYEDNYPTTNLESISCGTPVITYKTGGSPEAVTKEYGTVVEQGDIKGVISAIEDLKGAKIEKTDKFNKVARFGEYIKLYEEMTR
ncbi:MAG: glycosyltransferase [Clostridia bacterium]|nr:glycosyltransferase [Clostridia bacterium]